MCDFHIHNIPYSLSILQINSNTNTKINSCKEVHSFTIMDINSDAKIPKADNEPVAVASSAKLTVEVGERKAKFYPCPLDGCSRKCETKKLLMLHLAMSHFLVKMEASYISRRGKLKNNVGLDARHYHKS